MVGGMTVKRGFALTLGEEHHSSRITEADVLVIRKSKLSCAALSAIYGISRQAVQRIKTRQTWAWLTDRGTKRKYALPS